MSDLVSSSTLSNSCPNHFSGDFRGDALHSFVSPFQSQVLQTAAAIAQQQGFRLYAVGGIVRDWILASPEFHPQSPTLESLDSDNQDLKDIDLVVEPEFDHSGVEKISWQTSKQNLEEIRGAGILVAIALHQLYPEAKLQIHPKFQTAELIWASDHCFNLDLATARTETYPFAGANPEVKPTNLIQDLYRRDFTINGMAVELKPQLNQNQLEGTQLIDLFQGCQDLKAKLIRAIRAGSFAEDPRRIFRAVRFAIRFEMAIAPETKAEIEQVLASGLHDCIGGSRLRAELNYLLEPQFLARKTAQIWRSLAQLGALRCIYHPFVLPESFEFEWKKWQRCQKYLPEIQAASLEFLLSYFPEPQQLNLGLTPIQLKRLTTIEQLAIALSQFTLSHPISLKPSQITQILEKFDLVTLSIYATKTSDRYTKRIICQYAQTWRNLKSPISATELQQLGCPPGKAIGNILTILRNAVLDGEIKDQEFAINFAQTLIQSG